MEDIENKLHKLRVDLYTSDFVDAEEKIRKFRSEYSSISLNPYIEGKLTMLLIDSYSISGRLAEALDLSINLQKSNDISDNIRLLLTLIIAQTLTDLGRSSEINAIIETSLDDERYLKPLNGWMFLDILSFYTFHSENSYKLFEKQLKNIEDYLGIALDRNNIGNSISTTRHSWLSEKTTLNDIRSSKSLLSMEEYKRSILDFISIAKFKPHILEAERLIGSLQ
ncbi:hypothetical protein [Dyadobacter frigoris]|uniref:Uncharacterized protein n=1 Tax=Dyadobacter frigoris TaxID=2576211 RepID=A0A4U6D7K7_9BACT|nr:hypothetical protein [Dyadobacter frigoris]TKT92505.1 hypothetical protein FDK13_11130 [Dyadobacter frigoris]GLU55298.1 hypothetical protein Dfri01_47590 [Dyadobacter frigoris]